MGRIQPRLPVATRSLVISLPEFPPCTLRRYTTISQTQRLRDPSTLLPFWRGCLASSLFQSTSSTGKDLRSERPVNLPRSLQRTGRQRASGDSAKLITFLSPKTGSGSVLECSNSAPVVVWLRRNSYLAPYRATLVSRGKKSVIHRHEYGDCLGRTYAKYPPIVQHVAKIIVNSS